MNNLDSNTAALNAHELDQEKLFRAAEIAQDDLDMKIEELVVSEIESATETALEAIGTEATLSSWGKFDSEFKEILLDAIKCKGSKAQDSADKDLGKILRELVTDYIANDVKDLI